MNKITRYALIILLVPTILSAQVKINEVLYSTSADQVELKNFGASAVDVSNWWLCARFSYSKMNTLTIVSGSLNIPAGGILAVSGFSLNNTSSDLGLYNTNSFASASALEDFLQWGASGIGRESVAASKGIWTTGDFMATVAADHSIEYDGDGNSSSDWFDQPVPTIGSENGIVTSVQENEVDLPDEFGLAQNYPNPFNPATTIRYSIASPSLVTLNVYDLLGREVADLVREVQASGTYRVRFDASGLASGVYLYQLKAGGEIMTRRLLISK